uniref:Trehalase n=1 Tax=Xiphophorus couchianus TaxID=32473 RepID=A0A3B5LKX6_9TELE
HSFPLHFFLPLNFPLKGSDILFLMVSSPCFSEIYCSGPILHHMQEAKLFNDDKHFVDMKLKSPPGEVLAAFQTLLNEWPNSSIPTKELQEFLEANFDKPGTEFETWTLTDWQEKPRFLSGIADEKLRLWAEQIHGLWKSLDFHPKSGRGSGRPLQGVLLLVSQQFDQSLPSISPF